MPFAVTWMDLEIVILSERQRRKKYMASLICGIYFFLFYFIFKLYIIVLVLPNIKMNPPQVYMCI